MMKTVFVAMSGGVDSSVTAYLLKEQGYNVVGITMNLWTHHEDIDYGGCCSLSAVEDARRVSETLKIPHYVWNFEKIFEEQVVSYFCQEYFSGRTPNPCIVCNREIKFGLLLHRVRSIGADYLATGHYAIIDYTFEEKRWLLRRGIDPKKDQSYFLYVIKQSQLPYLLFPLGRYRKDEVRRIAYSAGLPVAEKKESQEICFIQGDYRSFLEERSGDNNRLGPVFDKNGNFLGEHRGLGNYTIGQRRGLGLSIGYPAYVIDIDRERNALIVGEEKDLYAKGLVAEGINYVSVGNLDRPMELFVKIRYTAEPVRAVVYPGADNTAEVRFLVPQKAVTPGQAVVFYDDDVVLGGGIISRKLNN